MEFLKNIIILILFLNFIVFNNGSPLYVASKNGFHEIVRLLLSVPDINVNYLTKGIHKKKIIS